MHTVPSTTLLSQAKRVVSVEIAALEALEARLDSSFERAIAVLESATGRVIVTGMGKSGIIGRKIAATFSSTGTPSFFLHPGEGIHGDLGMVMPGDVVIAISNSGETAELLQVLPVVKRFNLPMIAMTGNPDSTLARKSDVALDISVPQEACPHNLAPTASTTATLVMGDALAVVLMERKGFTADEFAIFHPAGSLGKRLLLTVEDVMHTGEAIPVVPQTAMFRDALLEITAKKLGITLVVDEAGAMCGVVSDGDVRRALTKTSQIDALRVSDVFTPHPKTIDKTALAAAALNMMETHQITVLAVVDASGRPEGVLHLHDLLKNGI